MNETADRGRYTIWEKVSWLNLEKTPTPTDGHCEFRRTYDTIYVRDQGSVFALLSICILYRICLLFVIFTFLSKIVTFKSKSKHFILNHVCFYILRPIQEFVIYREVSI